MKIIEQLNSTKDKTLRYFELPESDLSKSYGPGKWNIRQILHHLADAEGVLYDRIKRIIAEPKQVLWAFDQDLWSQNLYYEEIPLELSRDIYLSIRKAIIFTAEKYYRQLGDKEFVHSETGIRTLKDEIDKVAWHNQNHIDQIELALNNK